MSGREAELSGTACIPCRPSSLHCLKGTPVHTHTHTHTCSQPDWCCCWKKWYKEEAQPTTSLVHCECRKQISLEGLKDGAKTPAKNNKKDGKA